MPQRLAKFTSWIRFHILRRPRTRGVDTTARAERKLVSTLAKSRVPNIHQLRYLPQILSPGERFLIRVLSGLIVVSLIFLGARAYARNVAHLPRPGGEVVEAIVGNPQYINPILMSTNDVDRDLVRLLYAGLMKRNEKQEVVPDLAESVEISEDSRVYTVHLRPSLTWSNGQPLDADDVLLTFELIQDPLYKSPIRSQFRNVKVERVDERTVRFILAQPSGSFLSNLTVGILPAHLWSDIPPPSFALVEFNLKPIGSGPFVFESLKRDGVTGTVKEYRLIRNERFHGARPYLDRVTFKIYQDIGSATEAVRSKKAESINVVTKEVRDELKQVKAVDLQMPQYTVVFFNAKRNVLKTIEVRRALIQAIDRQRVIRDVLRGTATLIDGPFASEFPGYAGTLLPAYNPDEATKVLDAAGWTRPSEGGARKKGNDELALSLTVVDQPEDLLIADIVKENWEKIGAKVEVKAYDPTRIPKEIIKPREYDAFLYGEVLSADGDLYPFWHSSQEQDPGLNLTRFFNKEADELLEELRQTSDPAKVKEKRIAFQRLLAEGLHAVFLFSPYYTHGLAKRIKGFDVKYITTPADRFANVEGWYVKTKLALK